LTPHHRDRNIVDMISPLSQQWGEVASREKQIPRRNHSMKKKKKAKKKKH